MATIPDKFGTNLPKNYANLAGRSLADWGGYSNMPAYLQELAMSSQAPSVAAGASPANSPSAVTPDAGGGYAQIKWRGNTGMGGIPQLRRGVTDTYQIPVGQLADFMKSGYGSNFEAMGTFVDGQSIAPKMNVATYTDPMTGEIGKHLLSADKTEGLGYRTIGGTYLPENTPGWQFNAAAAAAKPTEEATATPAANTATTANAGSPYVMSETPDAFKYAEGGLVEDDLEKDETWQLIQRSKAALKERERIEEELRKKNEPTEWEKAKQALRDMTPFAKGGLVEVAQELRDKGRMGDSILAHISPDEARLLKSMGGAGTINPETGLPEYFKLKSLLKFVGPAIGIATGNPLLGALAGGVGGAVGGGGLAGGLMGALGGGLSGATSPGLQMFGGKGFGDMLGVAKQAFGMGGDMISGGGGNDVMMGSSGDDKLNGQMSYPVKGYELGKSGGSGLSTKDMMLLGGAGLAAAGAFANKDQAKKNMKMLKEQQAEQQAKQDEENKSFRSLMESQPTRTFTPAPADYYTYGNRPEWNYYGNYGALQMPERQFAAGGYVGQAGMGGGQDDTIPARLSNNEYVIPADVVAHLGDGTPKEGARKLDGMVGKVRKHKAVKGHPPKAKSIKQYTGGLA